MSRGNSHLPTLSFLLANSAAGLFGSSMTDGDHLKVNSSSKMTHQKAQNRLSQKARRKRAKWA